MAGGTPSVAEWRVLLLLAVIATAGLWLEYQLGFGLASVSVVAGIIAVANGVNAIAKALDQDKFIAKFVATVRTPFTHALNFLAGSGVLTFSTAVLAFAMLTLTTLTVIGEPNNETGRLTLSPVEGGSVAVETLEKGAPPARFRWVVTSPFGRLYRLEASGYVPATLSIHPLVGKEVTLGRDLTASPSVLLRPFATGRSALEDSASLRVTLMRSADTVLVTTVLPGRGVSFRIGKQSITDGMRRTWEWDLGAANAPPAEQARLLKMWNEPVSLTLDSILAPGDRLVAEIVLDKTTIVERGEIILAAGVLSDLLLRRDPR